MTIIRRKEGPTQTHKSTVKIVIKIANSVLYKYNVIMKHYKYSAKDISSTNIFHSIQV